MSHSVEEDARAVLLPAFEGTELSDQTRRFLGEGGVSILLGESRAEYVTRQMSNERCKAEKPETLWAVTADARARSGRLLAFVDQEMGGICRLHDLVAPFPEPARLGQVPDEELEAIAFSVAEIAVSLGINGFLAPIVDVLVGANPWLQGRTWSTDAQLIGHKSAAFVRGVQRGGVAATVKHFPGFGTTTGDPAIDAHTVNPLDRDAIEMGLVAFRAPIQAGADIVMVGPAIVRALDPQNPALRSAKVISILRDNLHFAGIVMADDLDSKATLLGSSVPQVALDALNAGCDLLLLADMDNQLDEVSEAIVAAVKNGGISRQSLAASARRVRDLAARRATNRTG